MAFKKGGQGLSVSFTIQPGKNERTSEVTTVYYSPTRLGFALPFPDDATDIVFDENRPYLNLHHRRDRSTPRSISSARNSPRRADSPLSATDAAAKWPNAKLDDKIANGAIAYYISENQRPIVLSLRPGDNGKINAEIKVPPFAEAQDARSRHGCLRPAAAEARQNVGRHRRRNHARGACPCDCRSRHGAGFLSPRTRGAPLEGRDPGRRRHSAGGHAQFHRAGRPGRAEDRPQIRPDGRKLGDASDEAGRQSRTGSQRRFGRWHDEADAANGARRHRRHERGRETAQGCAGRPGGKIERTCR